MSLKMLRGSIHKQYVLKLSCRWNLKLLRVNCKSDLFPLQDNLKGFVKRKKMRKKGGNIVSWENPIIYKTRHRSCFLSILSLRIQPLDTPHLLTGGGGGGESILLECGEWREHMLLLALSLRFLPHPACASLSKVLKGILVLAPLQSLVD